MSARQARTPRAVPGTLAPCAHLIRKRGVFHLRRVVSRAPRREVAIPPGTRRYGLAACLAERLTARPAAAPAAPRGMSARCPARACRAPPGRAMPAAMRTGRVPRGGGRWAGRRADGACGLLRRPAAGRRQHRVIPGAACPAAPQAGDGCGRSGNGETRRRPVSAAQHGSAPRAGRLRPHATTMKSVEASAVPAPRLAISAAPRAPVPSTSQSSVPVAWS